MKKLVIVCEEKLRMYADFLSQLVSLEDDKDEGVVGVKDGAVAAQVWTEKEYASNRVQISSEQYILFIGNSKLIKDKRSHMIKKFDEYGMKYGWLGKQAVLFVEDVVDIKDYDNFIEYARANQANVERLIEVKKNLINVSVRESKESKGIKAVLNPLIPKTMELLNAPIHGINIINKVANYKKIEGQEYTCLVLVFYKNGLSDYLGLPKE